MFGSNTVKPVFGSTARFRRFPLCGSCRRLLPCSLLFLIACSLPEYNHHRRERRGVFAPSEVKPPFYEPNFRFVVYVFVKILCVCPRRYECDNHRSRLLRFLIALFDPFPRPPPQSFESPFSSFVKYVLHFAFLSSAHGSKVK